MKSKVFLLILSLIVLFVACESKVTSPNTPLVYKGITVSETTPDFIGGNRLAKTTESTAQIESDPPYGTVYGVDTDPDNVYLSNGSEVLPTGSWTDQVYQETYKTTLFSKSTAQFDGLTTVTITDAVDCYYLDATGTWVEVTSDITVETTAIKTGVNGTCSIEIQTKSEFPGDGPEWD